MPIPDFQNRLPPLRQTKSSRSFLLQIPVFLTSLLYHCPIEIGLCRAKERGHGRPGRVDTGLLARTPPSGTNEHSNANRRDACAPFQKSKSKRLLVLLVLAIAGCATPKKDSPSVKPKAEAATKKAPISWLSWLKFPKKTPPPPSATPIDWAGVIRLVNEDERFVLIQAQGTTGVIAGEKYLCIRDAAETGVLRMTALRNPPFLIADILSGDPRAGDKVYLPRPTVVAPIQPPPP